MSFQSVILTTGESVQVNISSSSQVEVTGTFGVISLTSSTGLVEERSITTDEGFESDMGDMKFDLTSGAGPVVVSIKPLSGNVTPKEFTMVVT